MLHINIVQEQDFTAQDQIQVTETLSSVSSEVSEPTMKSARERLLSLSLSVGSSYKWNYFKSRLKTKVFHSNN